MLYLTTYYILIKVDFKATIFEDIAIFQETVFKEQVDFTQSRFKYESQFMEVTFHSPVIFFRVIFNENTNLRGNFHSICDLGESIFKTNADLRYADFSPSSIVLLDNMTYNKMLIKWEQIHNNIFFTDTSKDQSVKSYRKTIYDENMARLEDIINVYHALENNFSNIGQRADEDECYIKRKQIEEKRLESDWWPHFQTRVFGILCNYGVKPIKIIYWIVFAIWLWSLFFFIIELSYQLTKDNKGSKFLKNFYCYIQYLLKCYVWGLYFNLFCLLTKGYSGNYDERESKNINTTYRFLIITENIIIWCMITFLIIVLSKRIMG